MADQMFYEGSGGGVTFSGGEPLVAAGVSQERLGGLSRPADCTRRWILAAWRARNTCWPSRPFTDLFLYDLKFMDEAKHRRYTGVSNALILSNLEALGRIHPRIWIRVPVIPGINDSEEELEATARFVASLPSVQQVNLLPFHRTGLPKNTRLGRDHGMADVQPPSAAAMDRSATAIFARRGLTAKIGG